MQFKDKVALITGGSRGIGRSIVLALAGEGAHIFLNYLNNDAAAEEVKKKAEAYGAKVELYKANAGDANEVKKMTALCAEKLGRLDFLIHNAALGAFKPVMKLRENQWDLSLDINAKTFFLFAQAAAPFLGETGGSLLTLSSLGSHKYLDDYGAIGISKATLECLVRYLAVELGPKGIRVNCVSGGPIDTDALKMFPQYEKMKVQCVQHTPLGRLGKPEDISKVIKFLCSSESGWITGQTIVADGGLSLR
jgi:enoyl-[acyl-carrier protein] reductase III